MKIKRQMVSKKFINSKTYGTGNKMTHIAIHETANLAKAANAQAHANLQSNGNSRDASWHYQVDDKVIIQSFEDNVKCWHAGSGNTYSIGIEICVNGGADFKKAVANAAELVKHLMKKHNIPLSNVKQHNFFTGKDCPTFLRNGSRGINWNDFIKLVKGKNTVQPMPTKPSHQKPTIKPISEVAKEVLRGNWGNGQIRKDALTKAGYNYNQVQAAVQKLKVKSTSQTAKPALKSNAAIAKEVIAGKWGNGNERTKKLTTAGYDAKKIQAEVNKLLK